MEWVWSLVFVLETVTVEVIALPSTFRLLSLSLHLKTSQFLCTWLLQSLQANGMLTCSEVKMHVLSVLISTKPCSRAWSVLGLIISMFWNPPRQMKGPNGLINHTYLSLVFFWLQTDLKLETETANSSESVCWGHRSEPVKSCYTSKAGSKPIGFMIQTQWPKFRWKKL